MKKRKILLILLLALNVLFISHQFANSNTKTVSDDKSSDLVMVIRVIDGDTIEIEGKKYVRYIGIDTPETVKPNTSIQCFGQEASIKNKDLVEGKLVRLEKDVSETDKYGRLLRYVYVGDVFVNDYLVSEGYAFAASFPPDVKFQKQFSTSEQIARDSNKGLWSACDIKTKNH